MLQRFEIQELFYVASKFADYLYNPLGEEDSINNYISKINVFWKPYNHINLVNLKLAGWTTLIADPSVISWREIKVGNLSHLNINKQHPYCHFLYLQGL